jgi:hypothetical protein
VRFRHACALGLEKHRFEGAHEPLQIGLMLKLGEGEEPANERL